MRYRVPVVAVFLLFACAGDPESRPPVPELTDPAKTPGEPADPKGTQRVAAAIPHKTPNVFRVEFEMTCGSCVVECRREWAPKGADRFFEMIKTGFFADIAFFRVIPDFMAQFGIHGDPDVSDEWSGRVMTDDPVTQSNTRGMISFASRGPNTRTTQMFINFRDNSSLDGTGFAPFAKVVEGMENVDKIHKIGERPSQSMIQARGSEYLRSFPDIDYIKSATYLGSK